MATPALKPYPSDPDTAIDNAIASRGGDARAIVAALIVAIGFLETEVARLRPATSFRYARGRLALWNTSRRRG